VLEATCRLVESPPERVLLVWPIPTFINVPITSLRSWSHKPIGLEGFDEPPYVLHAAQRD